MIKKKNNNEELLVQLFEDGYATKEVELIPNKLSVVIRNIGSTEQIEIEKEMTELSGSSPYVMHTYGIKLLSATLIKYGINQFKTRQDCAAFLAATDLSSVIIDKLVKQQNLFEKEVRQALKMDEIDKVFFAPASPPEEQKPLPKASTQESEAVLEKQ